MVISDENTDIFLMDRWFYLDALRYLIGLQSLGEDAPMMNEVVFSLDSHVYSKESNSTKHLFYCLEFIRIDRIWQSGLHDQYNSPTYYINWAISKKIEIPWLHWAIQENHYIPPKVFTNSVNEIHPKERISMIKIIHALAKNGYRYPSHGSIKEMVEDFQKNNNGVDEKTLAKYLNEFDSI